MGYNTSMDFLTRRIIERSQNHRLATDKYWCLLFLVVLICWINSWQHAYNVPQSIIHEENNIITFHDGTDTKNISELVHQRTNNKTDIPHNTTKKEEEPTITGALLFLIKAITCNLSNINKADKKMARMDLSWMAFYSPFYFFGSMILLRNNKGFREQPYIITATFVFVVVIEHIIYIPYNWIKSPPLPYHEKLSCWLVPEMIFLIICLSKIFSKIDNSKVSDESTKGFYGKSYSIALREIQCTHAIICGIPFIVIFQFLSIWTIGFLFKEGWNNIHSYIIAGGSYYLGFTIYYYGLMVTSCSFVIQSKDFQQCIFKCLFRAIYSVARYHFGTACYLAVPIIPRLRATLMMNNKISDGFFVTHFEIYKLSTTMTAVDGTSHSKSMRHLFSLYCGNLLTEKLLQGFGWISTSLLFVLMSTNSFMIVSLADLRTIDDRLALATWVMYIKITFMFSLAMGFFTSTSDAFEISKLQNEIGNFSDGTICEKISASASEQESTDDIRAALSLLFGLDE